ncbi:MAG TPA: serine/threonine-protein kinase, partial [Planctomycetota bacterium]
PPEDLPLKPGQTFHGLEIVELIGRGGMGVVYKARQPSLDRMIALKILPKRMATDPDFQNRFIREAKALASLNHPNIVAVYDFGADAGLFFLAMEFVDGTNLRQILRDKTLTPVEALKIVPQLCDALEFAHAEGVVHRDIKPENILLDKKGRVKIADFGLAKLTGTDSQHANLTMTNMVMGTPHYMAPEQVENPKGVDHRADIYAIGVVFYEMLTGELPIGRFEMPSKKVQIDVRLDEVVLKTLEKAPDRRYQKAGEVRDAITRATSVIAPDAYMPTVMTPRPEKKSKTPLAILGAALLIAVGIAVGLSFSPRPAPPPVAGPTAPAGPVDLSPLHFGPDERPQRYVWADKILAKNPLSAKTPDELAQFATYLGNVGLVNLSPADLKQGYAAVWFRGTAAFVALESPIAERIERDFLALDKHITYRWTHRKGPLVTLAWVPERDYRQLFNVLVGMVQKKLGLPVEAPRLTLDLLKWDKDALPSNWSLAEKPDFLGQAMPGATASWKAAFQKGEDAPAVAMGLFDFKDAKEAEAAEKTLAALPGATRINVFRVGPMVAAVAQTGPEPTTFAKTCEGLRDRMGLQSWTFDMLVPLPAELPEGWTIDRVQTDPAAVMKDVGLAKVQPSDLQRAWRATFKPAGTVLLLEIQDDDLRNAVEGQVRQVGPGWRTSNYCVSVEGPDDETLDALENLMRQKCGWDANSQRPVKLAHVKRISTADLPKGYALGAWKADPPLPPPPDPKDRRYVTGCTWEIQTPAGPMKAHAQETNNYGDMRRLIQESGYVPGDLLLIQNFVLLHVAAPEASWDTLEALEAAFRKKMRMGKPDIEELPDGFAVDGKWTRLWYTTTRERAQIRKYADLTGLDPANVVAVRYERDAPTTLLFELKQPLATAPAPKADWKVILGRGRFIGAIADPFNPLEAEAVRGILRAKKG